MMFAGGPKQQYEKTRRPPNRSQETETALIWLHLKVFRLSKDDSSAHMESKRRRSRQKKSWEDTIIKDKEEWTGKDCASITREAENRSRWKMLCCKFICGAPKTLQRLD